MGDFNQYAWIKNNKSLIKGPVLEIGSRFYDDTTSINYRRLCEGMEYIGIDVSAGNNVDIVADFTDNFEAIKSKLGTTFNTIICCSVMEHVEDIYAFARNLEKIINPGGVLFLSVPFTWEYHGYPQDYWRFTPKAIKFLYPSFKFSEQRWSISSNIDHDERSLLSDEDVNKFILRDGDYWDAEESTYGIFRWFKKLLLLIKNKKYRREYLIRKILKKEYRLSLSCINAIGIKS
jgi:SAM-dependent methyltransferase